MEINSKKIIIPITLSTALVLLIIWAVYFCLIKNPLIEKQGEEQIEKSNQEYCLADDEVASYEIEKKEELTYSEAIVKIFIENKDTNFKKYSFQIDNVRKNYHPVEVRKCGAYMIRMFNYDPKKLKQDSGYREELWKYNYNGNGEMIVLLSEKSKEFILHYSSDFRVDSAETYITLEYIGVKDGDIDSPDYAIIIKNLKTKEDAFVFPFQKIVDKDPDLAGDIMLNDWSDDGRYFWFNTHIGANVLSFIRIDTTTWKADIFEAPGDVLGGDALNVNNGYITIHPDNVWLGFYDLEQEEKEDRRKKGIGTEIYIENLITRERYFIDKTDEPLWYFKPKWISGAELEYYLPSEERKAYEIVE